MCHVIIYIQAASIGAWNYESHVIENRKLYTEKFNVVLDILEPVMQIYRPKAGLYLWQEVSVDDIDFTRMLLNKENVTVLPGNYTSRKVNNINPEEKTNQNCTGSTIKRLHHCSKPDKNLINSL